jgi:hypothetical protein
VRGVKRYQNVLGYHALYFIFAILRKMDIFRGNSELPENIKEYDRATVRAVLSAIEEIGTI